MGFGAAFFAVVCFDVVCFAVVCFAALTTLASLSPLLELTGEIN
jgi:hypothetical protein